MGNHIANHSVFMYGGHTSPLLSNCTINSENMSKYDLVDYSIMGIIICMIIAMIMS